MNSYLCMDVPFWIQLLSFMGALYVVPQRMIYFVFKTN